MHLETRLRKPPLSDAERFTLRFVGVLVLAPLGWLALSWAEEAHCHHLALALFVAQIAVVVCSGFSLSRWALR